MKLYMKVGSYYVKRIELKDRISGTEVGGKRCLIVSSTSRSRGVSFKRAFFFELAGPVVFFQTKSNFRTYDLQK